MLRALNDRAALDALLRHGALSRIELEAAIGLSKPAAAELLRRLEESGMVSRVGFRDRGAPGPNATLWSVNGAAGYAAAADVTVGHIDVAIIDLTGNTVGEHKIKSRTISSDPVAELRTATAAAIRAADLSLDQLRTATVGISGSIDPLSGHLKYAGHMPDWLGFDVPARLSAALDVPTTVENDVNLVAIGESLQGCAQGYRDVVVLWMGQGVAAATLIDGRLHRGTRGGAGELDMAPLGGGRQSLREVLENSRVRRLAERHGIKAGRGPTAVRQALAALSLDSRSPKVTRAAAESFLTELADIIAHGVIGAVAVLDPELVVLAGDIGLAGNGELAARVAGRLHQMSDHRPEVCAIASRTGAVRDGAIAAAGRQLRQIVFGPSADTGTGSAESDSFTRSSLREKGKP